jgi:UDP-N-acetylglucosamine acyltransferase
VLHHHAVVDGWTELGSDCEVFPFACLGLKTQDLKFKGGLPGTRIGARNVFREYTTVHAATADGDLTVIGDDNHFLAYTHIAHDCRVGSRIVMSNFSGLAGHVGVADHVVIGAYSGVHQFCRIGARAMIGAQSKVVQDVPPCLIADGNPAVVRGLNRVGLERAGMGREQMERLKAGFRLLYRSGLNRSQALEQLAARPDAQSEEIAALIEFARSTERGLCPPPADWIDAGGLERDA